MSDDLGFSFDVGDAGMSTADDDFLNPNNNLPLPTPTEVDALFQFQPAFSVSNPKDNLVPLPLFTPTEIDALAGSSHAVQTATPKRQNVSVSNPKDNLHPVQKAKRQNFSVSKQFQSDTNEKLKNMDQRIKQLGQRNFLNDKTETLKLNTINDLSTRFKTFEEQFKTFVKQYESGEKTLGENIKQVKALSLKVDQHDRFLRVLMNALEPAFKAKKRLSRKKR